MNDKINGERKKLSLSSGGKLTLKNSFTANKTPNSITTNSRINRGTVQVEVKRTKRFGVSIPSETNRKIFMEISEMKREQGFTLIELMITH